eukprot:124749-Prymnesium_polylepis.1
MVVAVRTRVRTRRAIAACGRSESHGGGGRTAPLRTSLEAFRNLRLCASAGGGDASGGRAGGGGSK